MSTGRGRASNQAQRDRWWVAPLLQVLAGLAIIGLQYASISAGRATVLTWAVAAAGLLVMATGIRTFLTERPGR